MAWKEEKHYVALSGINFDDLNYDQFRNAMTFLNDLKMTQKYNIDKWLSYSGSMYNKMKEDEPNRYFILINISGSSFVCSGSYLRNPNIGTSIVDMYIKFREFNKRFNEIVDEVRRIIEQYES